MVMMIAGTFSQYTRKPFTSPSSRPTPIARANASGKLPPCWITQLAITYCAMAVTAGNEMSMPPAISTTNSPQARMPRMA
ncbi:Uncharacterised protein [Acinetobacter baumannii]|nr:Uncharacterised protein [Acinetobacter baumannii]